MVRMPAGHLPSPPMEAARLFPEPAAGEPYTILIMPRGELGYYLTLTYLWLTFADLRWPLLTCADLVLPPVTPPRPPLKMYICTCICPVVHYHLLCSTAHHAEGLVNPKVLAKKPVTDFRYLRACRFRKTKQTYRFRSPLTQLFSKLDFYFIKCGYNWQKKSTFLKSLKLSGMCSTNWKTWK
jgi:hypothetical protein